MYILVLESSTTSAKVMLYDTDKKNYIVESKTYELRRADFSRHDADDIFAATVGLGRKNLQQKSRSNCS